MDIEAKIIRVERGEEGTFGVLLLNGKCFAVTLELPWRDNVTNISCIPTGRYVCKLMPSSLIDRITKGVWKSGWVLQDVPKRLGVMFHPGNSITDTHGCPLLAQHFGKLRGDRAILNSGKTFQEFMTVTRTVDQFPLIIMDAV